jgi:hypothetical protein
MTKAQIVDLQKRVGTEPDGFWGPKSIAECKRHLRRLMPSPNPWPSSSQRALRSFYGLPGTPDFTPSDIIAIPAPSWLRLYDTNKRVRTIRCHKLVADSLLRALEEAHEIAPDFAKRYFGCYVGRPMRGGSSPSTHAYGAAIDLTANTNGNRTHWPLRANMPIEVMEAFACEGWTPAGAAWNRDAMHFQATRWT